MTSAEQMELMIKIRAQGQDAAAQLKRIEERMGAIKGAGIAAGGGLKTAFEWVGKGGHLASRGVTAVLAPLGWMAKGLTAAGVAAAAFGGVAVKSSGDMEALRLRLDGVSSSAKESKQIFEDAQKLGIASPFSDTQMVEAAIALRQFAMYSKTNLKTISDTATVAQRDMQEVVMAIVGMEAEPLRRLGIQFSAAGGNFVASYRTKLGEVKRETAKTRDEASQMLIDIFKARFGGAAGAFATSWKGVTSTLTGALEQATARLGDGMRKRLSAAVGVLNERIGELIESGKLDAIGEKIGASMEDAVDKARAAFAVVAQMSKTGSAGTMLMEAAAGAAEIMGRGFLEYLKAGYGVIAGIFRAAFAIVLQEYRMSDLPGADKARMNNARDALAAMTPDDATRNGIPAKFAGNQDLMMSPEKMAQRSRDIRDFLETSARAKAPWIAAASSEDATAKFTAGAAQSGSAVVDALAAIKQMAADVTARRTATIRTQTGYDPVGSYEDNLARIKSERARKAEEEANTTIVQRVRGHLTRRDTAGNDMGITRDVIESGKLGSYTKGQRLPSGYVVINVEQIKVVANTPQELSEKILALSVTPPAMAGSY